MKIYSYLENTGLKCCEKYSRAKFSFDLLEFALLREWGIPDDSFVAKIEAYKLLSMELELHTDRNEDELKEKHGIKEK